MGTGNQLLTILLRGSQVQTVRSAEEAAVIMERWRQIAECDAPSGALAWEDPAGVTVINWAEVTAIICQDAEAVVAAQRQQQLSQAGLVVARPGLAGNRH